jgi:hypothetical protein
MVQGQKKRDSYKGRQKRTGHRSKSGRGGARAGTGRRRLVLLPEGHQALLPLAPAHPNTTQRRAPGVAIHASSSNLQIDKLICNVCCLFIGMCILVFSVSTNQCKYIMHIFPFCKYIPIPCPIPTPTTNPYIDSQSPLYPQTPPHPTPPRTSATTPHPRHPTPPHHQPHQHPTHSTTYPQISPPPPLPPAHKQHHTPSRCAYY